MHIYNICSIYRMYSQTSLNLPSEIESSDIEYHYNCIIWAIVWEWSMCAGDRLERFYRVFGWRVHVYI